MHRPVMMTGSMMTAAAKGSARVPVLIARHERLRESHIVAVGDRCEHPTIISALLRPCIGHGSHGTTVVSRAAPRTMAAPLIAEDIGLGGRRDIAAAAAVPATMVSDPARRRPHLEIGTVRQFNWVR